jgi:predicted nuclease with TOPRIM domain
MNQFHLIRSQDISSKNVAVEAINEHIKLNEDNTRRLEKKHDRLKDSCVVLSKQLQKYEDIVPLTEDIAALGIGIDELIALKSAINQAVKLYNLPPLAAILLLIEDIRKFEKLQEACEYIMIFPLSIQL